MAITGIDGEWIERQQLKQYRADSGAVLNFWASTGTVNCQGPEQAAQELEAAVFRSDGKNTRAARPQPNTTSVVGDDAALRSLTSVIIQNRVGPVFDAESAQTCKIAQECMLDLCERLGLVVQAARHD